MVTQRPSGWYDDPHDENLLRYWDGVVWTEHVANRRPVPAQGLISEPAADAPAEQWARYQAQQGGFAGTQGVRRRADRHGGPGGMAQLSGWWRRVGAMLVDGVLVFLVCLPFTLWRLSGSMDRAEAWQAQVMEALRAGASTLPEPPAEVLLAVGTVGLVQTIVYVLLDAFFLSRTGVTPGRRLTGIRVRPVGVDQPVPFAAGVRRSLLKNVSNLVGSVPVVSSLAVGLQLVDYLWPLFDRGKQALHDKVAATEVVVSGPLRVAGRDRAGREQDGPIH